MSFMGTNKVRLKLSASAAILALGFTLSAATASMADSAKPASTIAEDKPELGSFGIDMSAQKASVAPGANFYKFANGSWLDTFELPADRTNYGAFTVLAERSEKQIKAIIDDLAATADVTKGSSAQKVRDYYNSYMDTETINARGMEPLRPLLNRIAAINSRDALVEAFGRARQDGTAAPITFGVGLSRENPDTYVMNVGMGGLSLGDRDFYLKDDERSVSLRDAFKAHVAEMLALAGIEDGAAKAEAILALETKMAEIQWPRADRRNRTKTFNPTSFADFKAAHAGYGWDTHLKSGEYPTFTDLNVTFPSTVEPLIALVSGEELKTWKDYLTYQAITNHAALLSEEIDTADWRFYGKTMNGQQAQRDRWKRAVARVGGIGSLGNDLGNVYIERHFKPEAKAEMEKLVANLRVALGERIKGLDWMGEDTKAKALEKLNAFNPKVAYPNEWELLDVSIQEGNFFENAVAIRMANIKQTDEEFSGPTNRDRWYMTPQTVNAYYNPQFNEIVFPAAILQPPFFDLNADAAVNYGGIGAVIGHEMGHGFDDQGSKADARGVQTNWWTDEDRANFEKLADTLVAQYNGYEALPESFVDGRFTLGENIGDVGGMSMAYHAYKLSLGGKEAPVIDGLTGDQRFFLSWAQVWKRKYRDQALLQRLKRDPHSPSEFRVNGVVRNIDAWYEAFGITKDDPMYLPPEQRVTIW